MAATKFYCCCVNVCISVDIGSERKSSVNEISTISKENVCNFFRDAPVLDQAQGIQISTKLECLCDKVVDGDWTLSKCINCGVYTFGLYTNLPSLYFLSSQLITNSQQVLALKQSPNFSPVYQILVPPPGPNNQTDFNELLPLSQLHVFNLRQSTAKLLNEENEIMINKIRDFENEEHCRFLDLKKRVQQEQLILQRIITSFYVADSRALHTSDFVSSPEPSGGSEYSPAQKPTSPVKKQLVKIIGEGVVFDMEEDGEEELKKQSDEIESDLYEDSGAADIDSSSDNDAFLPADKIYASSLPVSVPKVMHYRKYPDTPREKKTVKRAGQRIELDEDSDDSYERYQTQPENIAASIQAIAMSVRNDGTEMFGDRPRPRLNTLD